MEIIYVLLPLSLLLAVGGFCAFRWAVKNGQFEDTQTPAMRVLFEDDLKREKNTNEDKLE